ncbi:RnfH family protein [Pusillimonas caeni]|uniref:RnfH family protein n=1 Tax=Pusillimonas caeni TaxID=1348472 RepID=UPI000E59FEE2|nr:RnfH family protein [Pusillimonas caeni]TFL11153.1 RnfH family protein [Pusillimonas caeni]
METEVVRRRAGAASPRVAVKSPGAGPTGSIKVTVVHAERDSVWQTALTVPFGTDVGTVLKLSGFARAFPAYPVDAPAVGIFGRRCHLEETVSDGDRVEIYRPLDYDPMESRRRRAEHRKAAEQQTRFRPRRVRGADKS